MANAVLACHSCGFENELVTGRKVQRRDECERCGADLHCCRNCRFYDPARHNECSEPQAERVVDKERANFCDYFEPGSGGAGSGGGASGDAARKSFDDLFK